MLTKDYYFKARMLSLSMWPVGLGHSNRLPSALHMLITDLNQLFSLFPLLMHKIQFSPVYCQKKIVVHLLTLPCLRKHLLLFVLLLLVHNVAPLTCLLLCETILPKPESISVTVDFMEGQRASAQSVFTQIEERGTVNHLELSASFPASTFRSRSLHSKPAGALR